MRPAKTNMRSSQPTSLSRSHPDLFFSTLACGWMCVSKYKALSLFIKPHAHSGPGWEIYISLFLPTSFVWYLPTALSFCPKKVTTRKGPFSVHPALIIWARWRRYNKYRWVTTPRRVPFIIIYEDKTRAYPFPGRRSIRTINLLRLNTGADRCPFQPSLLNVRIRVVRAAEKRYTVCK
jgi:hypothetical protein